MHAFFSSLVKKKKEQSLHYFCVDNPRDEQTAQAQKTWARVSEQTAIQTNLVLLKW